MSARRRSREGMFAQCRKTDVDLVAMRDAMLARKEELVAQAEREGLPPAKVTALDLARPERDFPLPGGERAGEGVRWSRIISSARHPLPTLPLEGEGFFWPASCPWGRGVALAGGADCA